MPLRFTFNNFLLRPRLRFSVRPRLDAVSVPLLDVLGGDGVGVGGMRVRGSEGGVHGLVGGVGGVHVRLKGGRFFLGGLGNGYRKP